MFLPVDSIAFVRVALDLTPEITKTKGALEVVCTPTLKSILGLGNTKTLQRKSFV